jgi:hypothetical protein
MKSRETRIGLVRRPVVFAFLVVIGLGVTLAQDPRQSATNRPAVTKADSQAWQTGAASTWGKWGKDDQFGALNYITPAKRQQAAQLVKTGQVVSLERPIVLQKRHEEIARDGKPNGLAFYEMTFRTFPPGDPRGNDGFTSDVQSFAPHGALLTHLDALCHDSDGKGHLYNGYPLAETVTEKDGCTKLGLDTLKEGIVTRGVLVDMTRLKASHTPGAHVYKEDIEAWEKQAGVKVSPGDALFVYDPVTREGRNGAPPTTANMGFDLSIVPWMVQRGVSLTSGVAAIPDDPHSDHRLILSAAGIFLLDSPNLAVLAETAARLNRWEFMLTIAPPLAPGASGYPVNPLAIF